MSLSKSLFPHLKTFTKPFHHRHPPSLLSPRFLSYATPEEAAAARRRRKRDLRIEPPQNSLRHNQPQRRPQTPIQNPNPNSPKLPEHVSALTGKRLDLHNRILTLIRENDLEEAALLTRHSIYSNCKPTIFTCNAVMAAFLRQSRYNELLTLHRFITQAGVAANVVTHNLLINVYCNCRKIDTALEHYKQLINNAPFNPSLTTYRILIKALVDNSKVERAMELKDEMLEKGLAADPVVYNYLMLGLAKEGDPEKAMIVFDELEGKVKGFVYDGIVYGNLMRAYFLKGMETEAMGLYADTLGESSSIKMGAVAYNYMLQTLIDNKKFDEALGLFNKMMAEHSPPRKLMVNLGSFNVIADALCQQGKFDEAIEVFRKMGEKRCSPDTISYNTLIEKLCTNGLVAEAEDLYREMGGGAKPDEYTYVLLMDACFGQNRADDAALYFGKMVESKLKPNLNSYNKVVDGLIKAGKVIEANGIFSQMMERLKLEAANYEVMLRALCEASKLDEVLQLVGAMLRDEKVGLNSEMDEVVRDSLRKEGREEDLARLMEEIEREKAEALAKKAEEEKAAAEKAAEAAKAKTISAGTFSLLAGTRMANAGVASAEPTLGNAETLTSNQEGSGEGVSPNSSPAVGEIEDATSTGNQEGTGESVSIDASPAGGEIEVATSTGNQEGTGEVVSIDASPAVGEVEEAVVVNELGTEAKASDNGNQVVTGEDVSLDALLEAVEFEEEVEIEDLAKKNRR